MSGQVYFVLSTYYPVHKDWYFFLYCWRKQYGPIMIAVKVDQAYHAIPTNQRVCFRQVVLREILSI